MKITLPTPFHDEHLYSVIARYHRISANASINKTLNEFAIANGSMTSQNIFNITFQTSLIAAARLLNQSAAEIAERHTIFPLYKISLPEKFKNRWIKNWREVKISKTFEREWINDRMLKFDKSWRYCPNCIEDDKKINGTAYWHVQHQLPSIKLCHTHKVTLRGSCIVCNKHYASLKHLALPESCNCPVNIGEIDLEWDNFVSKFFKERKNDDQTCLEKTTTNIKIKLNLDKKNLSHKNDKIINIMKEIDQFYGTKFLSEIFSYYEENSVLFRGNTRPNFLKTSLLQNHNKIRNPIFYLLLQYEKLEAYLNN